MSAAVWAGYKLTEAGVIPEDWSVQLLNDVAVISRLAGAEYTSLWKETLDGAIVALRGFNIGMGQIIERDLVRITNKLSWRLKRSRLCKGDVVYPCVGSIGNAVVITEDDRYHIQQNIARITPDQSKMDSFFLANYLMSYLGEREVNRFNSSSSQPSVLVGNLRQYRVAMPPTISEQQTIATAMSDVDALLAKLDALIAKKRDLKVAAMQQLLTGQTRLPGFSGEWEVLALREILDFESGKAHEQFIVEHGDFIVVNSKFISTNGEVKKYSNKNVSPAKVGDILMVMSDLPNGKALAKCFIADKSNLYAVNQRVCILRPKRGNAKYFYYALNRNRYFLQFDDGVQQTHLLNPIILKCPLGAPKTTEEQAAIATALSDMDAELTALESRRDKTRELKQGMMQELLTGRIRLVDGVT